ncbi:MAG: DUF3471 domain-containing protein [Cyclobacteriaceae bacterium]|nr:DUF3471 domain-containing protein [Cyclobacteriaceae bacterium]
MNLLKTIFTLSLLISIATLYGQQVKVPFTDEYWDVEKAKAIFEEYQGKESILVGNGPIVLKDVLLENGTIEFDINFPDQRAFPGIGFRWEDKDNHEIIYFRPGSSGDPDALQYNPVFNGRGAWQLYHGKGYTDSLTFKYDEWQHIKLEISGDKARLFWDDRELPALSVVELKRAPKEGKITLRAMGAPVHFANFQYTKSVTEVEETQIPAPPKKGTITNWQIGGEFARDEFYGITDIDDELKKAMTWKEVKSEGSGLVNLSEYVGSSNDLLKSTTVARVIIHSDKEEIKRFSFGFSDEARVYYNDRLVFVGKDAYLSRDHQFSGLIGYYDALYLPLKKGENEVWMVVTENFGGWGIQARLEDVEVKVEVAAEILRQYAGEYAFKENPPLAITFEEGRLRLSAGPNKYNFFAVSQTRFQIIEFNLEVEFRQNDKGETDAMILYQNNRETVFKKKTE